MPLTVLVYQCVEIVPVTAVPLFQYHGTEAPCGPLGAVVRLWQPTDVQVTTLVLGPATDERAAHVGERAGHGNAVDVRAIGLRTHLREAHAKRVVAAALCAGCRRPFGGGAERSVRDLLGRLVRRLDTRGAGGVSGLEVTADAAVVAVGDGGLDRGTSRIGARRAHTCGVAYGTTVSTASTSTVHRALGAGDALSRQVGGAAVLTTQVLEVATRVRASHEAADVLAVAVGLTGGSNRRTKYLGSVVVRTMVAGRVAGVAARGTGTARESGRRHRLVEGVTCAVDAEAVSAGERTAHVDLVVKRSDIERGVATGAGTRVRASGRRVLRGRVRGVLAVAVGDVALIARLGTPAVGLDRGDRVGLGKRGVMAVGAERRRPRGAPGIERRSDGRVRRLQTRAVAGGAGVAATGVVCRPIERGRHRCRRVRCVVTGPGVVVRGVGRRVVARAADSAGGSDGLDSLGAVVVAIVAGRVGSAAVALMDRVKVAGDVAPCARARTALRGGTCHSRNAREVVRRERGHIGGVVTRGALVVPGHCRAGKRDGLGVGVVTPGAGDARAAG